MDAPLDIRGRPNWGPRINIPPGMTAEQLTRKGMRLEDEGISSEKVGPIIGISPLTYRQMRDICLLADHPGLNQRDTKLAKKALALMNETERASHLMPALQHITDKLWGATMDSARRHVREAKRLDAFETRFGIVLNTCASAAQLELPYLSADRTKKAIREIRQARRDLATMLDRLNGEHADDETNGSSAQDQVDTRQETEHSVGTVSGRIEPEARRQAGGRVRPGSVRRIGGDAAERQ